MEDSDQPPKSSTDYILSLNECDAKIVNLLRIHADAVKCLTASDDPEMADLSQERRQEIFKSKISEFLALLTEVREMQHKAIYALKDTASGETGRVGEGAEAPRAVLGELGELDVSYLNSRNDDVGKQIEAEQWARAAELVTKLAEERNKS